jgi:hypothetical protein
MEGGFTKKHTHINIEIPISEQNYSKEESRTYELHHQQHEHEYFVFIEL